jgi:proline dehydrogenase
MVIDAAPGLLHAFTHSPIPGLKALTEFVVRYTFFDQFVAGENLPECVSAMHGLYNRGMGGVLNYSAEAELGDGLAAVHRAAEAHNFQECTNAIEALGEFERQIVAGGGVAGSSSFAIKIVSEK